MAGIPAVLRGHHRVKIALVPFRDGAQLQCGDVHGYRFLIDRQARVEVLAGEIWLVRVLRLYGRMAFCQPVRRLFGPGELAQAVTTGIKPYVDRQAFVSIMWDKLGQHDGKVLVARMDINEVLHVTFADGADFRIHHFFPDDANAEGYSGAGFDHDGRPIQIVFWSAIEEVQ